MPTPPPLEGPGRNIAIPFGAEKLEWWGYTTLKKFDDMCRLNVSTQYRSVTDVGGQTDRPTDIQTSCHGIVRNMHTRRAVKTYVPELRGRSGVVTSFNVRRAEFATVRV